MQPRTHESRLRPRSRVGGISGARRAIGYGQAQLRINGELVKPDRDGKEMGETKEFPVDPKFLKDGRLVLTWDRPQNEGHLNWRQKSRLAEVWLIKHE